MILPDEDVKYKFIYMKMKILIKYSGVRSLLGPKAKLHKKFLRITKYFHMFSLFEIHKNTVKLQSEMAMPTSQMPKLMLRKFSAHFSSVS